MVSGVIVDLLVVLTTEFIVVVEVVDVVDVETVLPFNSGTYNEIKFSKIVQF